MKYTKYLRSCGAIVGHKDAGATAEGNDTIGLIAGDYNGDFYYITTQGQPELRTVADSVPESKTVFPADGVDSVVVTGLPPGCWLRVNDALMHINSGNYVLTSAGTEQIFTLELVGQYSGMFKVTAQPPTTAARDADARWQALANATPLQIRNWINNNVTDLASARQLLVTLTLAVRALNDKR